MSSHLHVELKETKSDRCTGPIMSHGFSPANAGKTLIVFEVSKHLLEFSLRARDANNSYFSDQNRKKNVHC